MARSALHSRFKTDETKQELGIWTNFGGGDVEAGIKDVKIRIRRLKSKKSLEVREQLDKPFANELRRGAALPKEVAQDLALRQIAQGVISDWEGVTKEDGTEIVYTPDNAFKILKELPEFADAILQVSVDMDNYKHNLDETAEKN